MSDQENNTDATVQEPGAAATPAPASRKSSSAVGWLALLLVLALAAAAAWFYREMQLTQTNLVERIGRLEADAGREEAGLRSVETGLREEIKSGLAALQGTVEGQSARYTEALVTVEAQLAEQRQELARLNANDRESWLLAEAEYLLRLANQRLVMAGDTVAARALLQSADDVVREIDDAGLHDVRAALAADTAAVRAVPGIDVEGIYLRLAALVEQADTLVIFTLPQQEDAPRTDSAEDWQGRLRDGYENALLKLSDYIIIRRRDVPVQALMDPQWEGLVRQNLRMLLEQAQVALLSGNQTLYAESLQRANHWVAEFFESDESAARAMASEIDQLADLRIAVEMPDISRSLSALDDAIERRLEQGGAE